MIARGSPLRELVDCLFVCIVVFFFVHCFRFERVRIEIREKSLLSQEKVQTVKVFVNSGKVTAELGKVVTKLEKVAVKP